MLRPEARSEAEKHRRSVRAVLRPRWLAALAIAFAATPSPTCAATLGGPNWSIPFHDIDPQIAAGPNHVLIADYDHLYYFTKNGRQITHDGDDPSKPELATKLSALFDGIRAEVNSKLRLPPGAECKPSSYGDDDRYVTFVDAGEDGEPDVPPTYHYCLSRFGYDARVLWDEYRQRFVVVAVAVNESAKCKYNPGANPNARRNKILVAYSAGADPTDGRPWSSAGSTPSPASRAAAATAS